MVASLESRGSDWTQSKLQTYSVENYRLGARRRASEGNRLSKNYTGFVFDVDDYGLGGDLALIAQGDIDVDCEEEVILAGTEGTLYMVKGRSRLLPIHVERFHICNKPLLYIDVVSGFDTKGNRFIVSFFLPGK